MTIIFYELPLTKCIFWLGLRRTFLPTKPKKMSSLSRETIENHATWEATATVKFEKMGT